MLIAIYKPLISSLSTVHWWPDRTQLQLSAVFRAQIVQVHPLPACNLISMMFWGRVGMWCVSQCSEMRIAIGGYIVRWNVWLHLTQRHRDRDTETQKTADWAEWKSCGNKVVVDYSDCLIFSWVDDWLSDWRWPCWHFPPLLVSTFFWWAPIGAAIARSLFVKLGLIFTVFKIVSYKNSAENDDTLFVHLCQGDLVKGRALLLR